VRGKVERREVMKGLGKIMGDEGVQLEKKIRGELEDHGRLLFAVRV